jgi:hypothetical protein
MWKYFLVRADCEANASANNSSSNQVDQISALKKLNNNIHGNSSRINKSITIRNSSPSYTPDTMMMTKNQLLSINRQMILDKIGHAWKEERKLAPRKQIQTDNQKHSFGLCGLFGEK